PRPIDLEASGSLGCYSFCNEHCATRGRPKNVDDPSDRPDNFVAFRGWHVSGWTQYDAADCFSWFRHGARSPGGRMVQAVCALSVLGCSGDHWGRPRTMAALGRCRTIRGSTIGMFRYAFLDSPEHIREERIEGEAQQ